MSAALHTLLAETRARVAATPALAAFVGDTLDGDLPFAPLPPVRLPAVALAESMDPDDPLARAVIAAAPDLHWQQSYTAADGFDADYLARYGWFNLVSPDGAFLSDAIRVSVGYWGTGLHYTEHWHAPEEIYLVLAGGARFHSQGRAPVDARPGDMIHHAPNQKHAIDMVPGPLLAKAFWKGAALMAKSGLKGMDA
jgi:mannose-6-phosphate isomerase-like protein (cupin superfamily)